MEAWTVEDQRAQEEAGLSAIDREFERESDVKEELAQRIAMLPARTAEGVCAKVRAAMEADCREAAVCKSKLLPELLAQPDRMSNDTAQMLLYSAMVDAATLAPTSPAIPRERSAA